MTKRKKKDFALLGWIHQHSLSLVLAAMTVAFKASSAALPEGYWHDLTGGFGDDTWGAFVIVVATKYFMERGSAESNGK